MDLIEKWEKSQEKMEQLCREIGDKIEELSKIAKDDGVPYYSMSFRCRIPYADDGKGGFDGMSAKVTRGNTLSDVLCMTEELNDGGLGKKEILYLLFDTRTAQAMADKEWSHLQEILPKRKAKKE